MWFYSRLVTTQYFGRSYGYHTYLNIWIKCLQKLSVMWWQFFILFFIVVLQLCLSEYICHVCKTPLIENDYNVLTFLFLFLCLLPPSENLQFTGKGGIRCSVLVTQILSCLICAFDVIYTRLTVSISLCVCV